MRKMLNLRYRLLPYIYSEAWQITHNRSTMMRPLTMDFNSDTTAVKQPFEYMFGKALLVAPVTEPNVKDWSVYLPKTTIWYDFWTGNKFPGGQTANKETPIDIIPLYVKAGSILPLGPEVQFATEKKWDNLELRIYEGANGKFTLYEDENDNYDYEKGVLSTIEFNWNDASRTLTIGKRNGDFPGMLKTRTFQIIIVSPQDGVGVEVTKKHYKEVNYDGQKRQVIFR
jgi:alpha-D-xyloside xylohydrolase